MAIAELIEKVQESISVRRVFGEPYEQDGTMIIPVASVGAGAGGGSGEDADHGTGEGGGFGGGGRPVGVYVVRNGEVSWQPAVDANRLVAWVGAVLIVLFVAVSRGKRAGGRGPGRRDT